MTEMPLRGKDGAVQGAPVVTVREARATDAADIAALLDVLGYPATADEVVERLGRLQSSDAVAYVADLEGHAVGVVTGHVVHSIHSTPIAAWLTTLSVNDRHQRTGIGAQLARAVESWAGRRGAVRVSVTSGLQRAGAHAFYERLGYDRTGVRLTKSLVR